MLLVLRWVLPGKLAVVSVLKQCISSIVLLWWRCAGGTSIEDLAEKYPEKIIKIPIDVFEGITDAQVSALGDMYLSYVELVLMTQAGTL